MPQSAYYVLTMPVRDLTYATDMLRFDDCFEIEYRPDRTCIRIHCLRFTPARWASFGVKFESRQIERQVMSRAEYNAALANAIGFTNGVRFAQKWIRLHKDIYTIIEASNG